MNKTLQETPLQVFTGMFLKSNPSLHGLFQGEQLMSDLGAPSTVHDFFLGPPGSDLNCHVNHPNPY